MRYFVLSGSQRRDSQSAKVAGVVVKRLGELGVSEQTDLLDLGREPLPIWDEGVFSDAQPWPKVWHPVRENLRAAEALVIITPEWHGMATAGVRNFFQLCSLRELAHKPALLVTVSASRGGAYPVAELRSSSYKNNRICYIPEHLIVQGVGAVLNGPQPESESDTYIRERLDHCLKLLGCYASGLLSVRQQLSFDFEKYPNGM